VNAFYSRPCLLVFTLLAANACSTSSNGSAAAEAKLRAEGDAAAGTDDGTTDAAGADVATTITTGSTDGGGPGLIPPGAQPAVVAPNPNAPAGAAGQMLSWTSAPVMSGVQVVAERDSVRVVLPSVPGAVDFRVFAVDANLAVSAGSDASAGGSEHIKTGTMSCAGYRQRGEPTTVAQLTPDIEYPGITTPTTLVVEAIDTTCPFVGLMSPVHGSVDAMNSEIDTSLMGTYSVYTEAEIVATYDALILNGQRWNTTHFGYPAPPIDPTVLARTTITVTPLGYSGAPPTATFFDDFATEDPITVYTNGADSVAYGSPNLVYGGVYITQNSKWSFFGQATTLTGATDNFQPAYFDRARLHFVVTDDGQDDFATVLAYPKQAANMPSASGTNYLHVTYEVNSDTTDRRYWWLSLCGPDQASSAIMDGQGFPANTLNPNSSLQNGMTTNPGNLGWNCLEVLPRNATSGNGCAPLPPDGTNPETDIGLFVYPTGKGAINIAPNQYGAGSLFSARWYRQMDSKGNLIAPMLDDQDFVGPTTRFDVYVRPDRFVMYVNGQQRICNDFPKYALTMAQAMVGYGQILYHTSDEHINIGPSGMFCNAPPNTPSMSDVYHNELYMDGRDWDNVGFDENVTLPGSMASFDDTVCYVAQ
jgi:hypothetical protein